MALFKKQKVNFKRTVPKAPEEEDDSEEEEEEEEDDSEEEEEEEEEEEVPVRKKKRKKPKEVWKVVKELPTTPVRKYQDEEGTIINLMTTEEALTKGLNETFD